MKPAQGGTCEEAAHDDAEDLKLEAGPPSRLLQQGSAAISPPGGGHEARRDPRPEPH